MKAKYKLYGTPVSPFSYLIHAALIYKKVDFEYGFVDLFAKQQKEPEYLKLHPYGQVPVLVTDDGYNIYESLAIFEYLEEKFPDNAMLPKDLIEKTYIRSLYLSMATLIIPKIRELMFMSLGAIPYSVEDKESKKAHLVNLLKIFENEYVKLKALPVLGLIDAIFYQSWNNLNLAYPLVNDLLPRLKAIHNKISQNVVIQEIESLDFVVASRKAFGSRFTK